jgi:hypothetical protein
LEHNIITDEIISAPSKIISLSLELIISEINGIDNLAIKLKI